MISRSTSTLRGHFPAETDIIAEAWPRVFGGRVDAFTSAVPGVPGGRAGHHRRHPLGRQRRHAGSRFRDRAFARDPTFGYGHSNLKEWVAERSGGRWLALGQVGSIGLRDIRTGGPSQVARIVMAHDSGAAGGERGGSRGS